MAKLPDVPGKSLITGMAKGTRVVVAAAGTGALAVGGLVAKRVLGHRNGGGDGGTGASADPIAETPTAPPGAEEKPVPKPKLAAVKPNRRNRPNRKPTNRNRRNPKPSRKRT
jgi:hypothetical protein